MSNPAPKSVVPLVVVVVSLVLAIAASLLISEPRQLIALAFLAVVVGVGLLYIFPPARPSSRSDVNDKVSRSVLDSRNEVINAMSILQQEIRLLQSAAGSATEKKAIRDEVAHLAIEVAALKQLVQHTRK